MADRQWCAPANSRNSRNCLIPASCPSHVGLGVRLAPETEDHIMATKYAATSPEAVFHDERPAHVVDLQIDGMEQIADGVFRLTGVELTDPNMDAARVLVASAGFADDAYEQDVMIERLLGILCREQIGRVLAKRSRRVD